jgi:hypothetical protein
LSYEVLRRVDPLPLGMVAPAARTAAAREALLPPSAVMLDGWDYVASVPAHGDSIYSMVVPTLVDSSIAHGLRWSVFKVRATTLMPLTTFLSPADSGYSVDNLPPVPPASFAGTFGGGATHLTWDDNLEADLWYYRLHKGSTEGFVPGPGNLIATRSQPGYDDVGTPGSYYKLAAVDVNGNVSGFALLTPENTAGVGPGGSFELALSIAGPNPSRNGRLILDLALPARAPARVDLLDVTGRRVASRELGALGAGRHLVDLTGGTRLESGVYVVRLTQDTEVRSTRAVILR